VEIGVVEIGGLVPQPRPARTLDFIFMTLLLSLFAGRNSPACQPEDQLRGSGCRAEPGGRCPGEPSYRNHDQHGLCFGSSCSCSSL